jgi:hypothetical protein
VKKQPWHWNLIHQIAFDNVKTTIAKEVVRAYPNFTKPFDIYTDASTKQLGSVITQDNRPIAFFSWKLSGAQSKYTVPGLELLAIMETLKEFNGMLWGQRINVYTDHKNLTRDGLGLTSDRVAHWRILSEEYAPEIIYIKGIHNTVTNAISRLDYDPKLNTTNEYNHVIHVKSTKVESNHKWILFSKFWSCFSETQDPDETNTIEINHVFANCSKEDEMFPLKVKEIVAVQKADPILKHFFNSNAVYTLERFKVCCRRRRPSSSSVPIEFPRECTSVNPRNCTPEFACKCISVNPRKSVVFTYEFPHKSISVNPSNCTYEFSRRCLSVNLRKCIFSVKSMIIV